MRVAVPYIVYYEYCASSRNVERVSRGWTRTRKKGTRWRKPPQGVTLLDQVLTLRVFLTPRLGHSPD